MIMTLLSPFLAYHPLKNTHLSRSHVAGMLDSIEIKSTFCKPQFNRLLKNVFPDQLEERTMYVNGSCVRIVIYNSPGTQFTSGEGHVMLFGAFSLGSRHLGYCARVR
jgi:hypothetical protein